MNKIRILILEDDGDIIDLVASALGAKYEFYAAANGLEGMQLAQRGEPDLIVCDIMMPVMDGWEFVRRLRKFENFEKTPVIFLTALTTREHIRNGYQLGAGLYLTKPIDPIRLKRNIELFVEDHGVAPRTKAVPIEELLIPQEAGSAPSQAPRAKPADAPRKAERPAPVESPAGSTQQPQAPPAESAPRPQASHPAPQSASAPSTETTQPGAPKHRWRPSEADPAAPPKVRILVVEDDPDTVQMIRSGLSHDFEFIQSGDGITAIENAVRYKPDLFIIDGMLPKMTGYQLTMMLRKNHEFYRSPIIFISGKSGVRDQQYVQKLGVNEFLAKPFKIKELQALIKHIIEHPNFTIRANRVGMGQAYLEQLQHKETHRSEPVTNLEQLERRHLENILRRQLQ